MNWLNKLAKTQLLCTSHERCSYCCNYGWYAFGKQIQQLKGAQVVVATPGRLLDLVNRRQLKLDKVDALIVDEADRMLDLGFSEDLEAISDLAANRGQTLMFSATLLTVLFVLLSA